MNCSMRLGPTAQHCCAPVVAYRMILVLVLLHHGLLVYASGLNEFWPRGPKRAMGLAIYAMCCGESYNAFHYGTGITTLYLPVITTKKSIPRFSLNLLLIQRVSSLGSPQLPADEIECACTAVEQCWVYLLLCWWLL